MKRWALALALLAGPASASSLLPLQGPRGPVSPGRVAVFSLSVTPPAGLQLRAFDQEAPFYRVGQSALWVALLAVPLETRPGLKPVEAQWGMGASSQWSNVAVSPDPYPRTKVKKVRALKKKLKASAKANEREILEKAEAEALGGDPMWRGAFRWPIEGEVTITSPFGGSRNYNKGEAKWRHKGVDLRAKEGSSVISANNGVILLARKRLHATGGTVIVGHGYGLTSSYYHMSKVLVRKGQQVLKGEILGLSGSTGLANGPHLHWQMELRGKPVQPTQWVEADADNEL